MQQRIVLAYSGGLQTTAAIPWLPSTSSSQPITRVIGNRG